MPLTLVKLFNTHIIEFIEDLCLIVDDTSDLLNIKSSSISPLKILLSPLDPS